MRKTNKAIVEEMEDPALVKAVLDANKAMWKANWHYLRDICKKLGLDPVNDQIGTNRGLSQIVRNSKLSGITRGYIHTFIENPHWHQEEES